MRFFIEGFYDHSTIEAIKMIEYKKELRSNDEFENL
jgi:hypothetical protein